MTIAKADILGFVNDVLRRNETDIDTSIELVLADLSDLFLFPTYADQTVLSTAFDLVFPADALTSEEAVTAVKLIDATSQEIKLAVMPGGFEEYQGRMVGDPETLRGIPYQYVVRPPAIHLWPPPSDDYTARVYYFQRAVDADTILLTDDWKPCMFYGAAAQVAAKYGLNNYTALTAWMTLYEKEKAKRRRLMPRDAAIGGRS